MSFTAVLIATSVAFTIIGAGALAITSLPSAKLYFTGLPVKITGYLFGPLIGFITGFLSDLLSFLFIPSFYHPLYSVALAITGALPGVVAWIYFKFGKSFFGKEVKIQNYTNKVILSKNYLWFNEENVLKTKLLEKHKTLIIKYEQKIAILQKSKYSKSLMNFSFISSIAFLSILMTSLVTIITFIPEHFFGESFLESRTTFYLFTTLGISLMLIFITFMRFYANPRIFLNIVPIIVFSAAIEFSTISIIAYGDFLTLNIDFQVSFVGSLLLSPFKIWGNALIILVAYNIVAPLVKSKENNSWN